MLTLQERVKLNKIVLENSHFLRNGILIEYKVLEEILNLFTDIPEEKDDGRNNNQQPMSNNDNKSTEKREEESKTMDEILAERND